MLTSLIQFTIQAVTHVTEFNFVPAQSILKVILKLVVPKIYGAEHRDITVFNRIATWEEARSPKHLGINALNKEGQYLSCSRKTSIEKKGT